MVLGSQFGFVVLSQGDACTSCPSLGIAVGDGLAVPGPKGERGEPGPPGQGKNGKNVWEFCIYSLLALNLCTIRIVTTILHVLLSGKTRLTRSAGAHRSQRRQGLNVHLLFFIKFINKCIMHH